MMTVHSTRGYTYHNLEEASIDEVVADFNLSGQALKRHSGVAFARKIHGSSINLSGKDSARGRLISLYDSDKWPMGLDMLTMPGLKWIFERQILQRRGRLPGAGRNLNHAYCKAKTNFTCVENDEMIYRGAIKYIPSYSDSSLKMVSTRCLRTNLIKNYLAIDVEDYIEHPMCPFFDAAWFDFTGFLTERRLEGLKHFWQNNCGLHLTLTTLAARWSTYISSKIKQAGGLGQLISSSLEGSTVFNEFNYFDGIPMHQITLTKTITPRKYFGYDPFPRTTISHLINGD
jgi:hypothetical protein